MQIKFESPFDLTDWQRTEILRALHSNSLAEAAKIIGRTRGLASYRGGNHVAIHPGKRGVITGETRIAIITAPAYPAERGEK